MGVLEHQVRKEKPLKLADIKIVFNLVDQQAKALMMDTFQQWGRIKERLKIDTKAKIVNPNTAEMSIEFYGG